MSFFVGIIGNKFWFTGLFLIFSFAASALEPRRALSEENLVKNEQDFLDRLMQLESGGDPFAKNSRSSTVGALNLSAVLFLKLFNDILRTKLQEIWQTCLSVDPDAMLIPKTPRKFALAKAPENKKDKITNTFKPQLDNLKTFTKFIVRHPFKDSKL